jgi:hypothetical protein
MSRYAVASIIDASAVEHLVEAVRHEQLRLDGIERSWPAGPTLALARDRALERLRLDAEAGDHQAARTLAALLQACFDLEFAGIAAAHALAEARQLAQDSAERLSRPQHPSEGPEAATERLRRTRPRRVKPEGPAVGFEHAGDSRRVHGQEDRGENWSAGGLDLKSDTEESAPHHQFLDVIPPDVDRRGEAQDPQPVAFDRELSGRPCRPPKAAGDAAPDDYGPVDVVHRIRPSRG